MYKFITFEEYSSNMTHITIDNLFNNYTIESGIPSVILNKTFNHTITSYTFDNLNNSTFNELFKDGRVFSHIIERWLVNNYPLNFISGCKDHDHNDINNLNILYDEKTFTKYGCIFIPSNMIGKGRKFDQVLFEKKAKKIIYCIISNINFPDIQIKFISGVNLIKLYPNGRIPIKDKDSFFN
jgi:hypothetical protein